MATYKVIQDIEAEDKFVGPLSLKQFIFAMFGALFGYLSFFMVTRGLTLGLLGTLPPMFFGFFMAIPWSSEQPTDVWVLAKIRFRMKPNMRIWDQSGQQELVTITAPKKEERILNNNMSQTEVRSRLKALAETLDSRGWVIKNAPLQPVLAGGDGSDRLIGLSSMSQAVPETDENTVPDMMDEGQGLDSMIKESDQARKEQLFEKLDRIRQGEALESAGQPEELVAPPAENPTDEESISQTLKAKKQAGDLSRGNMHTVSSQPAPVVAIVPDESVDEVVAEEKTEVEKAQAPMKEQAAPDILGLARNNDLNIATIARQANNKDKGEDDPKEVVIALH